MRGPLRLLALLALAGSVALIVVVVAVGLDDREPDRDAHEPEQPGPEAEQPGPEAEQPGPQPELATVLWEGSFESPDWPATWFASMDSGRSNRKVVDIGDREGALEVLASADNDGFTGMGSQVRTRLEDLGVGIRPALGLRYSVYLPQGWDPHAGGKLPGLGGVGDDRPLWAVPAGGEYDEGGWSGRLLWGPVEGDRSQTTLFSYLYVHSANARPIADNRNRGNGRLYGITVPFREDPDPTRPGAASKPLLELRTGRWHTIELVYRLNTPGEPDGVFRAWIDGELGVDLRDVEYRTADNPNLGINVLLFDSFFGGPTANTSDQRWYFGDIAILGE